MEVISLCSPEIWIRLRIPAYLATLKKCSSSLKSLLLLRKIQVWFKVHMYWQSWTLKQFRTMTLIWRRENNSRKRRKGQDSSLNRWRSKKTLQGSKKTKRMKFAEESTTKKKRLKWESQKQQSYLSKFMRGKRLSWRKKVGRMMIFLKSRNCTSETRTKGILDWSKNLCAQTSLLC